MIFNASPMIINKLEIFELKNLNQPIFDQRFFNLTIARVSLFTFFLWKKYYWSLLFELEKHINNISNKPIVDKNRSFCTEN